ncbi:hypothetical protein ACW9HQ_51240 [Nocardia gipuzkoensis]
MLVSRIVAVALLAGAFVPAFGIGPASSDAMFGSCSGGVINWTADNGGISMSPKATTIAFAGEVNGCTGTPQGISGGSLSGTQNASGDCNTGVTGPVDLTVSWNNGTTSRLSGIWTAHAAIPDTNVVNIVGGEGAGQQIEINTTNNPTPTDAAACWGDGLTSGSHSITAAYFR